MLDVKKFSEDIEKSVDNILHADKKNKNIQKDFETAGRVMLLSTNDYEIEKILQVYYQRQIIEQVFDISKTYAGIIPLRGHSEAIIRGCLLLSFLEKSVYTKLSYNLTGSKYQACLAIKEMNISIIRILKTITF